MKSQTVIFNRFLQTHSFYPLFLSSLMAGAFFAFRVLYSGSKNYSNLLWNLFLAWLPYILSVIASSIYRTNRKHLGFILILTFFWLVFFPNAPYMVTDFYHLDARPPIPLWFDISLIAIFAFTGCFLAIASLRSIHIIIEGFLGKIIGWIFALFALGLGSLGVYLGRFGRFNSWDILLKPKSVLKEIVFNILNPMDNLGFVGFTLMFTSILLVFYLMFVTASHPSDPSPAQ
ncbi:MAG: hypothetical protein A2Y53_08925 [Chloroflexi bacterium RBG_16_47_49]|nr:MAG: hypothetical protein A2Y53_08925 [Chloroflexi bacterium RBG_16_47_49]